MVMNGADGAVVLATVSGTKHTSRHTINWPVTGGVHLFAGRVMALSLVDNSARVRVRFTNTHSRPSPHLPPLKSLTTRATPLHN